MIFQLTHQNNPYTIDTTQGIDLSFPIAAGKENPTCYYAAPVQYNTIRAGDFIGSVAEGGSCNYQQVTFTPHGNGTHTECYGHITADTAATLNHCLQEFWFIAQLISIEPQSQDNDHIITWESIEPLLTTPTQALIIRTLPNNFSKKNYDYSGTNPPYLLEEVGKQLAIRGIKHLLIDLPSVDRESDEGKLLTHRAFWQYPHNIRKDCTITELIYVPNDITDGLYALNLQISSFVLDAVPSKPIIYPLTQVRK